MGDESGTFQGEELHLLRNPDGKPFEGETRVQLIRVVGAKHFFLGGTTDARLVLEWEPLDFPGMLIRGYHAVLCECSKRTGMSCLKWNTKGAGSRFCRDASVALGRLPKKREALSPERLFAGRIFRADIHVVRTSQYRDPRTRKPEILPESNWYSKIARLVAVEAGPRQA
jgi:hypothetical protein